MVVVVVLVVVVMVVVLAVMIVVVAVAVLVMIVVEDKTSQQTSAHMPERGLTFNPGFNSGTKLVPMPDSSL